MEEKTEQLRDIFMEVADEESVTETQAQQRGSLLPAESVDGRLADVVGRMRERFDFGGALDEEALVTVVERFYDGEADRAIADALDCSPEAVFAARMDLHLIREDEPALDPADIRDQPDDAGETAVAEALDADPDQVSRARQVVAARREAQLVSHRFRTEFEEILTDADVAVQYTADARADGLEEAAEDIETEVDF
jgi:hypothetical protein